MGHFLELDLELDGGTQSGRGNPHMACAWTTGASAEGTLIGSAEMIVCIQHTQNTNTGEGSVQNERGDRLLCSYLFLTAAGSHLLQRLLHQWGWGQPGHPWMTDAGQDHVGQCLRWGSPWHRVRLSCGGTGSAPQPGPISTRCPRCDSSGSDESSSKSSQAGDRLLVTPSSDPGLRKLLPRLEPAAAPAAAALLAGSWGYLEAMEHLVVIPSCSHAFVLSLPCTHGICAALAWIRVCCSCHRHTPQVSHWGLTPFPPLQAPSKLQL